MSPMGFVVMRFGGGTIRPAGADRANALACGLDMKCIVCCFVWVSANTL